MNKAVFLDRDGIIIRERGDYNYEKDHIVFIDGIAEALKILYDNHYLLIIISNQGGIALNLYDHSDFLYINQAIEDYFSLYKIELTDFYYCPHHPTMGKCLCRKPGTVLLEKAIAKYNIDPSKSYFIGDKTSDIEAGNNANLHSILIPSNDNLMNYLYLIDTSTL